MGIDMDGLAERVVSRFHGKQAAPSQGPHLSVSDNGITCWMAIEAYGQIHTVQNELKRAEKLVRRLLDDVLDALRAESDMLNDAGIYYDANPNVIVDGLSGGRNRMYVYSWVHSHHHWDDGEVEQVEGIMPNSHRGFKEPPK